MISHKDNPTDVLVIGSGVGGLTAAIILLKTGCRVTVVEKNPLPGGLMRSYQRDGIDCPVGVHYLGALAKGQPLRRMFDYLGVTSRIPVERMGSKGVIDRYIFNDFIFDLPEGISAFAANLLRAFPEERLQIDVIVKNLKYTSAKMDDFDILFAQNHDFVSLVEYIESLGNLMTNLHCSAGLRSVLGMTSTWIGIPLDECPIYYHHMALASYLSSSWRLTCSGADMADAFASRVKNLGGTLMVGDPVERVLIDKRVVEGVALKSGRVLKAKRVVGAIHPKILLGMLPEGAVKPAYIKRISNLEDTPGSFSAHFAVDAEPHQELSHNVYRVFTDGRGTISDVVFYQLRKSNLPGINLLSIITPSPSAEWNRWEHTRSNRRGDDYRVAKQQKADRLIREAAKIVGPFKGLKMLDASTHLTLRDWVNTPGGSAYGVLRSTKQLTSAAMLNRTSVEGLFLAGQSVLAPGIFGTVLGSFYTVKQMMGHKKFLEEVVL